MVPLRGPADTALVPFVPVCDVLILAGGFLVLFEAGRDFLRAGILGPDDCSSEDEDGTEAVDSVGRVRSWRLVPGGCCAVCSIRLAVLLPYITCAKMSDLVIGG